MRNTDYASHKLYTLEALKKLTQTWHLKGKTFAFTNGCFDILHTGHLHSINEAAKTADYLIVAINTDASVKQLKGEHRPIQNEQDRAIQIASLLVVDAVILFDQQTPIELIHALLPDVLVKGGDYTKEQIIGAKEVEANGGQVIINPVLPGYSTTNTINRIKASL